jgi:hypothetical protein
VKDYTIEEITAKAHEIFANGRYEAVEVEVTKRSDGSVAIRVEAMYEIPGLSFAKLAALAEFFETKNIDDERFHSRGCETCDYGSCYGFELVVRPDKEGE